MNRQEASEERPDIYIGLVGAAGTDLEPIKSQLKAQLASLNYEIRPVKLSTLIAATLSIDTDGFEEDHRIRALMNAGDLIRKYRKSGDAVISLAAAKIRQIRNEDERLSPPVRGSRAFLIDSLKNPSEVQSLRKIYGRNFYVISVYSPRSKRINKLSKKIASSCGLNSPRKEHHERAISIVDEDEKRDATDLSQDVLNTFPKADFFSSEKSDISIQIKRFVELIFGEPFTTPTIDEYAMFMAQAASRRSCDLSRQVGAIITDPRGAVISSGCNDVPYPGGGIYYEGRKSVDGSDAPDNRDYKVEFDPNASEILNAIREIVRGFKAAQLLCDEAAEKDDDALAIDLMRGDLKPHLMDARVRNLIEFGRVVHAEMNAVCEAARLGRSTEGTTLYCTTFPCHICARHIIASGVLKVVFIEPYTKSMTRELYADEISTDDNPGKIKPAVRFEPFSGIAPRLYQRVFAYRPRKNKSGTIVQWSRSKAIPRESVFGVAEVTLEENFSAQVDAIKAALKPAIITQAEGDDNEG